MEAQQQRTHDIRSMELVASSVLQDLQFSSPDPGSVLKSINYDVLPIDKLDLAQHTDNHVQILAKPIDDIDTQQWHDLIFQLPSSVIRRLLFSSLQDIDGVRVFLYNNIQEEIALWRETRLSSLMSRLKKTTLKTMVTAIIERLTKLVSVASDCWEEQQAAITDFARTVEPYMFGAYELGCDFKQQFSLCVEIFFLVLEGLNKIHKLPIAFDVDEVLLEWAPDPKHIPNGIIPFRGFVDCLFKLWARVLYMASVDPELENHPTQLHQLFAWSVRHDTDRRLAALLMQLHGDNGDRNKAHEIYELYVRKKRSVPPHPEDEEEERDTYQETKRAKHTSSPRKSENSLDSYSSSAGSSCHQCKSRRNYQDLIFCTNVVLDKKNKSCRKKYCDHCLKKFYHEDAGEIPDKSKWSCPSCRKICCCAACRRKDNGQSPMLSPFESPAFLPRISGLPNGLTLPSLVVPAAASAAVALANSGTNGISTESGSKSLASSFLQVPSSSPALSSESLGGNGSLAMMYAVSMMPNVQKLINDTIQRKDLNEVEKVNEISSILQDVVKDGAVPPASDTKPETTET